MAEKTVRLDIKRQNNPNSEPYREEFELRWRPGMNVISALMDIAMDPGASPWKADHADCVRLELSGRSLWVMRHANQWSRSHGVLLPHRQAGTAYSSRTVVAVPCDTPQPGCRLKRLISRT